MREMKKNFRFIEKKASRSFMTFAFNFEGMHRSRIDKYFAGMYRSKRLPLRFCQTIWLSRMLFSHAKRRVTTRNLTSNGKERTISSGSARTPISLVFDDYFI